VAKLKIILIFLISFFLFYFFYFWWYSYFFYPRPQRPNISLVLNEVKENYISSEVEILKLESKNGKVFIYLPKTSNLNSQGIILFFHGLALSKFDQAPQEKIIFNLVKKGYIVIFPNYQENIFSPFFSKNLILKAKELSLEGISKVKEIAPENDFSKFSILGISLGGAVATNFFSFGLPQPKALILITPAQSFPLVPPKIYGTPFSNPKEIPKDIFLVGILAEKDRISPLNKVKKYFLSISSNEKYLFKIPSDNYGNPPLISNHFKIFDDSNPLCRFGALEIIEKTLDCTFYKKNCDFFKFEKSFSIGKWSDGREINKIIEIELK